jgi:hypothetical protein
MALVEAPIRWHFSLTHNSKTDIESTVARFGIHSHGDKATFAQQVVFEPALEKDNKVTSGGPIAYCICIENECTISFCCTGYSGTGYWKGSRIPRRFDEFLFWQDSQEKGKKKWPGWLP